MTTMETPRAGLVSESAEKWATRLVLLYFGLRLVYFACAISSFVPPDEVTHAGVVEIFSKVLLLPVNGPQTYEFGLVTNIPWLYYWSMGKLLHLNIFGFSDLLFLRLVNIPLAFGSVFYARRLLRLLTEDRLTALLFLVAATNTAMFTLLSASVSYDNLTNLLAVMATYYLFAFFRKGSASLLAASLFCQMLGALTKVTFLPLALALEIVLVIHVARNPAAFVASMRDFFPSSTRRAAVWLVLLIVACALNLQLYGGNYLAYGTLNPSLGVVTSPEAAMNYRLDARGTIFNQFKEGKISYMDAVMMAGEIKHPGDKADTFYLLMNYQKMKNDPSLWMGPLGYGKHWFQTMTGTIIGIKGHLGMYKSPAYLVPLYLIIALAAAGFVVRWRPGGAAWMAPALAAIALFYAAVLIYEFNYEAYRIYADPNITVYGRYLFPIIFPVYVLVCHYLLELFRGKYLRLGLALAVALLFICYDFPWFLAHATPEWFSGVPQ